MRGEFLAVWEYLWPEVWKPLSQHLNAPDDLFMELYRNLNSTLNKEAKKDFWDTANDPDMSLLAFSDLESTNIKSEQNFLKFLEEVEDVFEELEVETLMPVYHQLITEFIARHHLRYNIASKGVVFNPTLEGIFDSMVDQLRTRAAKSKDASASLKEFEQAIGDLRSPRSESKIKRCIHTGFNLMEAMGKAHPDTSKNTLGQMSREIKSWPHHQVQESIQALYGFASDFEGMRHAGSSKKSKRDIELRDTVAMMVIIIGFTPYLTEHMDHDKIIGGI